MKEASFDLRQGEIMAIAGVAGNGQKELVEALAGIRPNSGSIEYQGEEISHLTVRQRISLGINMVPEDRIGTGLVPNLSLIDNSILRNYYKEEFLSSFFIDYKKVRRYTEGIVDKYNVYFSDLKHPVNYLSGAICRNCCWGGKSNRRPECYWPLIRSGGWMWQRRRIFMACY